jgi:hypothetical protein
MMGLMGMLGLMGNPSNPSYPVNPSVSALSRDRSLAKYFWLVVTLPLAGSHVVVFLTPIFRC